MHKYLEFISLGLLRENEPVAFNRHGSLKEHITCACWESDMFTPRLYWLEIATKQTYRVTELAILYSEIHLKRKRKSYLIYCRAQVNSEKHVFVCHLNMTPADMSQQASHHRERILQHLCVQCVTISLALQYGDLTSPRAAALWDVCNLSWHCSSTPPPTPNAVHCFSRHCSPATSLTR